ncbi:hypothetical protein CDL12_08016 [Handroanthus impetiginosus]|uniref:25S rRNA (uridine-N(3))-methyltransferase BMT5-like domain-containing protein n=1 Tax=Handroanthus impetiginosus TaxID=429701 RepID=A0A2G9HP51_9LAMI|nr:hypothetical protein CDL12_08016 [Handroanthus impetiginosus]
MDMEMMRELRGGRRDDRWIKHYSSNHDILLVGDGDFSFSLCLAMAFCSATNIVATSLDSYDVLILKYKNAKANVATLRNLGASVIHEVDATTMSNLPYLQLKKFHRIIFNFPHAGFHGNESNPDIITMHRNLVRGFLMNASSMLRVDGEIHISHKITAPFGSWRIVDLGFECSLRLIGLDDFRIEDYPGYQNKRGSGSRSDEPFPLGKCSTFRFTLCPVPGYMSVQHWQPPVNPSPFTSNVNNTNECLRIFGGYLNHVEQTFGSTSYNDVYESVHEALRLGYEMYVGAAPGRPLTGYISILEELHRLSILRADRLRQMLLSLDQ